MYVFTRVTSDIKNRKEKREGKEERQRQRTEGSK